MTEHARKTIRRITLVAAAVGLLVPVTVSQSQGIEGNEACASGNCCRELNSVCMKPDGNALHHYPSDGSCDLQQQTEIGGTSD